MGKLNLKRGQKVSINGVQMSYHGSFSQGDRELHDFVRRADSMTIEYYLFEDVKSNGRTQLSGRPIQTHQAHSAIGANLGSGSDLYLRGIALLGEAA